MHKHLTYFLFIIMLSYKKNSIKLAEVTDNNSLALGCFTNMILRFLLDCEIKIQILKSLSMDFRSNTKSENVFVPEKEFNRVNQGQKLFLKFSCPLRNPRI